MNPFNVHSPRFLLTVGVVSAAVFAVTLLPSNQFLRGDLTGGSGFPAVCDIDGNGASVDEMRGCIRSAIRGKHDFNGDGEINRDDVRAVVRSIRAELSGSPIEDSDETSACATEAYCTCKNNVYNCSNAQINATDSPDTAAKKNDALRRCSGQACARTPSNLNGASCKIRWDTCTIASECCSNVCGGVGVKRCVCYSDGINGCTNNAECCSGSCSGGTCAAVACKVEGTACTADQQCCSNTCISGFCARPYCKSFQESCDSGSECCSGSCVGVGGNPKKCQCLLGGNTCSSYLQCCSGSCSGGFCVENNCKSNGQTCTTGPQCCSNTCSGGICVAASSSTFNPESPPDSCKSDGVYCAAAEECCSGICPSSSWQCAAPDSFGTFSCKPDGYDCINRRQCCSDNCSAGSCVPVIIQCADGIDNDSDGAIDYPADVSCGHIGDTNEEMLKSYCQDGIDNDGDGATDHPSDTGCSSQQDQTEQFSCSNTLDDDADGFQDYPADSGCSDRSDSDEKTDCQDGVDNDGDSRIDFPSDTGCWGNQDGYEE